MDIRAGFCLPRLQVGFGSSARVRDDLSRVPH